MYVHPEVGHLRPIVRMPKAIYLDNAATTRVTSSVAEVVHACLCEDFGNPASAHHLGVAAERRVKRARAQVQEAIGDPDGRRGQIQFTSGGTEADALAVMGAARARKSRGRNRIVLSALEHPAVTECAKLLGEEGFEWRVVRADASGWVDPRDVIEAVDDRTAVCAIMCVQNEIGTLLPVSEIAEGVKRAQPDVHVHCDAVQALGKIPLEVCELGVDSLALSAHKIHGPKGVGALWLAKDARVRPLWRGGGQEHGMRAGTLNVPGIAGFGQAAHEAMREFPDVVSKFASFAAPLRSAAHETGIEWRENGAAVKRALHIVSLSFRGIPAEPLLHVLESRGVLVSAGSACSERDRKPSPVLKAIGLPADFGTIRFSFGRDTTLPDVEEAARVLTQAVRSFA
jgi:cysteine desulfurase